MISILVPNMITTIEPQGNVSAANASELQSQLNNLVMSEEKSILLVDMKRVEFMDSAGLMVLVEAMCQARDRGLRFILCSLNESVRMIFELTQLDRVFEIFDSRDAFEAVL